MFINKNLERHHIMTGIVFGLAFSLFLNIPTIVQLFHGHPDNAFHVKALQEDASRYYARMHEVADGYPLMGNPALKEHRTAISPTGFIDLIPGLWMRVTGMSLARTVLLTDLFFPVLTILLLFLWIRSILRSTFLSIGAVIAMSLSFGGLLQDVNPKLTLWLLCLYLCVVFLPELRRGMAARRGVWPYAPTRWTLVARGVLLGLLFHSYSYHWTLVLPFEGLAVLHALFVERRPLRTVTFDAACVFVPFFILITPYTLVTFAHRSDPAFADVWRRWGVIPTRIPMAPFLQISLLTWLVPLAALRLTGVLKDRRSLSLLLLLLAGLVAVNSNLVTGHEAEFQGHYGRVLAIFTFVTLFLLLKTVGSKKLQSIVTSVLVVAVLAWQLGTLPRGLAFAAADERRWHADDGPKVLAWIATNVPPESVILAPYRLAGLVPLLTRDYIFMNGTARFFLVTDDELMDRYLALSAFFPEDAEPIAQGAMPVFGNYAGSMWAVARSKQNLSTLFREPFTKTIPDFIFRQDLRRRYERESVHPDPLSVRVTLNRYALDYLVTDREVPSFVKDRFQRIATVGSYSVYRHGVSAE